MPHSAESLSELPLYLIDGVHFFLEQETIVAITDLKGTIVFASPAFCRISGYGRLELLGQNHRILKSGTHSPEFFRDLWRTIVRGNTWRGEICNRAKDGHLYWVDSLISPIRDADGRIAYYCSLRIDITAQKEAQQQLLLAAEQRAQAEKMAAIGRMTDGVLHDLNNLLASAMLACDSFESRDEIAETQRETLQRMAQLVRNLRDFSTGRPTERRRFDAGKMLADTCRLVSFDAVRQGRVRLEVDVVPAQGCTLLANEGQILQIVLNLITNAIEATEGSGNGEIRVRTELDARTRMLRLFVSDNGPGVSSQVAQHLFEPFASSKGKGRGLGLAAARTIAREHGGSLELLSGSAGACFCLALPAEGFGENEAIPASNGVVLIVENDQPFSAGVAAHFAHIGFLALSSSETDEAMVRAAQFRERLSCAILDTAAREQAFALMGFLRGLKPDLPVVLVSDPLDPPGFTTTKHGPVYRLPKPVQHADLIDAFRRALAL